MLGNLVASCLLATAVAAPKSLSNVSAVPVDQRADDTNDGYSFNTARGYVIRNYDDRDKLFLEDFPLDHDVSIDFSPFSVAATYLDDSATDFTYGDIGLVQSFTLDFYADTFSIHLSCSTYDYPFELVINDVSTYNSLFLINSDIEFFGISFFDIPYLTTDQTILFNTVFTAQPNEHFIYYNGWYHIEIAEFFNIEQYNIRLAGTNFFSNLKYNFYYYGYVRDYLGSPRTVVTVIDYRSDSNNFSTDIYTTSGGWYNSQKNIYFSNVFMPVSTYNKLDLIGDFEYRINPTPSGWTDLFTGIADTPVIMLTSMFSFDLLGVPFYTAFFGIVTAVVMFFIIKKVW